jgi:hypothetical protein
MVASVEQWLERLHNDLIAGTALRSKKSEIAI